MFAQLEIGGEGQGVHAFVVPIRDDGRAPAAGVRIEDDGLKIGLNGVDNGRLWFDGVRVPRGGAAQPVRRRGRGRHVLQRHREPEPPLLHDARHPGPGPGLRRRRGHQRGKVALAIAVRYAVRRRQFEAHVRRTRSSCSSTTACTSGGCSRCWPGPTRCTSPRRSSPRSCTTCSPAARWTTRQARRELESRAAGTKALGTWHATRTIQECREACGGAGYLAVEPVRRAQGRHRRVHDVRGRQPRAAPAGRQGAAHRLRRRVRGDGPARHGPLRRPGWPSRRWSSGPARTSCSSGSRTCCPGATAGTRRPGILDPNYHLAMLRFREEHMLGGRRAPPQARHRRRDESRRRASRGCRTT